MIIPKYKILFNEKQDKFVVEYIEKDEKATNIDGKQIIADKEEFAYRICRNLNAARANDFSDKELTKVFQHIIGPGLNPYVLKRCKDCKEIFMLSLPEHEWFKNKEMSDPIRCKQCRIERKRNRNV